MNLETDLKNASKYKLSVDVYNEIKENKKLLYLLNKPPEESLVYTLKEIPTYLKNKFGLNPSNAKEFLKHSNRKTQKARELTYSYLYASLIKKVFEQEGLNKDVAIMEPFEDRGIDCYIRIVSNKDLNAIPLQICEIKENGSGISDEKIIQNIYNKVKKAKAKPVSESADLLCVVSSDNPTLSTIGTMRDKFLIASEWEYEKILYMQICSHGTLVYTVYLKGLEYSHYMINNLNGKFCFRCEKESVIF